MELLNLKWFDVVWCYDDGMFNFESEEVEAEDIYEAEERVQMMYGSRELDFKDVVISSREEFIQDE